MIEVNSAALEAVIDAAQELIDIKSALRLPTTTLVLGEDDPIELIVCIDMLKGKYDHWTEGSPS